MAGSFHPGGANFAFCNGSVTVHQELDLLSWTFNTANADSYGDAMPDNTTFVVVPATLPAVKSGEYLLKMATLDHPPDPRAARCLSAALHLRRWRGDQLRLILRSGPRSARRTDCHTQATRGRRRWPVPVELANRSRELVFRGHARFTGANCRGNSPMIRMPHAVCILLAALLTGCGQGSLTSDPGRLLPRRQARQAARRSGLRRGGQEGRDFEQGIDQWRGRVLFPQGHDRPVSPAPSSGTLTVGKKKVTLKSEGDALVTPTGPPLFAKSDVDGILSVDLDGKPISIPLGVR